MRKILADEISKNCPKQCKYPECGIPSKRHGKFLPLFYSDDTSCRLIRIFRLFRIQRNQERRMSVGCLNLQKVLLHHVAGGIGIAVGAEIGAGVVHANVLVLCAAALPTLSLVLEHLVAHDRYGSV